MWAAECYNKWFPEVIQETLQRAAVEVGYPPDRFKRYSVRIGGATALYHHFGDTEVVKRWGRWLSGAFHAYLWKTNEAARGVSAAMAQSASSIHVGYKVGVGKDEATSGGTRGDAPWGRRGSGEGGRVPPETLTE